MSFLLTAWGFLRSKAGMILAIVALVLLAMWRIFVAGKQSERAEQQERRLEAVAVKRKVDDEVRRTDSDTIRQRMHDDWSR